MDQPHPTLLTRLRSLLSHDKKIIENKLVDKKRNSGYRTKTVKIKGFPTVFFCSANSKMDEQEKTRLFLLSPEVNEQKLRETIAFRIAVESDRKKFRYQLETNSDRALLRNHVKAIKDKKFKQIIISEDLQERIRNEFLFNREFLVPRHQRDVVRLMTLIKAHALFNFKDRKLSAQDDRIIIANETDVKNGIELYRGISRSNELGLTQDVFRIYNKLIIHLLVDGFTKIDFQNYYFKLYHCHIGIKRTNQILNELESAGLIIETKSYEDLRVKKYVAPRGGPLRTEQRILAYDRNLGLAAYAVCQLCKKRQPVFRVDAEAYLGEPVLLCKSCFETTKTLDELRGIKYEDKDKDEMEAFIGL
jgi:hypothetical protein